MHSGASLRKGETLNARTDVYGKRTCRKPDAQDLWCGWSGDGGIKSLHLLPKSRLGQHVPQIADIADS